jgi:hypothetical protein
MVGQNLAHNGSRFRDYVNICSPAFGQTVYVAGVHVQVVISRAFFYFSHVITS